MAEKEKLNLYQKLLKIQEKIMWLKKDSDWDRYKYVSWSKVLEHIKPLMNEYWLILKQEIINIENTRQDYIIVGKNRRDKDGKEMKSEDKEKNEILSKVIMKFTRVDCETWDKDENLFGANGQNWWDKWVWSALTYWERYFLLKYFHIDTDEDDIDLLKKTEFTTAMFDKFKTEFKKYKDKYPTPDDMLKMLDAKYILPYQITRDIVKFYTDSK